MGLASDDELRSAFKAVTVTAPSDTANLANGPTRAIWVGVSGSLCVTLAGDADGSSVVLGAVAAGVAHPLKVKRVWASGTTASSIVALY